MEGYINTAGERQGTETYINAGDFSEGIAVVRTKNNKLKFLNYIDQTATTFVTEDIYAQYDYKFKYPKFLCT